MHIKNICYIFEVWLEKGVCFFYAENKIINMDTGLWIFIGLMVFWQVVFAIQDYRNK